MKVHGCILLLSAWALLGPRLYGEEKVRLQTRTVSPGDLQGIATGYSGHFACLHFSGISRELAIAVSDVEPSTVEHLMKSGADIDARTVVAHAQRMTILQTAVVYEWGLESIRLLTKAGADVNARDQRGHTSLTLACSNPSGANLDVLTELIRAGGAVDGKGPGGMSPLMYAALYDRTGRTVQTLLDASADVSARDNRGWTSLMHATRQREEPFEIVQLLVRAGAPVNARNAYGGTALSNAAFQGHTRSVQFLIEAGADVNSRDTANWTPLICAASGGHARTVELLVDGGARITDTDRLGRTALRLARDKKHTEVEEVLVRMGARE